LWFVPWEGTNEQACEVCVPIVRRLLLRHWSASVFRAELLLSSVAPIGIFNQHYAIDLGSFLLPLGVFLLLAVRYREWSQLIIGIAAFGSSLHLLSHLRDGFYSTRAVIADAFFLAVALLLIAPLVIKRRFPYE
jgi:hypothetical protein